MFELMNGDCLELMKQIPDGSVDMILCDLPYGHHKKAWDSVIPFEPLWMQYNRIIKDNGAIVLFGSEPFSTELKHSNIRAFRYEWIWRKQKPTNFYNAKWQPLKEHETIAVFSKHKPVYYPQGTTDVCVKSGRKNKSSNLYCVYNGGDYIQTVGNYPRTILEYPTEGDKNRLHPTQKPVALLEYLVKTYTKPGEVVLDNCMGSGSTGVACVNTGRKFIGIELDENYYEIAKQRINNAAFSMNEKGSADYAHH